MKLSEDIVINGKRAMARSYAKINLTLDIVGTRDDGYHLLETIMQTVNLSDIIIVDKADEIRVTTNKKFLPSNNKNIAYKAAEVFFEKLGSKRRGAKILIHKNIPVAAGLAGGSGNAAAVLTALNMLYSNPFSEKELLQIGLGLGADVPYCMMGGVQMATGIGEKLSPLKPMSKHYILLVTPPIPISTPWAYAEFNKIERKIFPDNKAMIKAIEEDNYYDMCKNLSNVLEEVTVKEHPVLRGIKEKLILNGANGALMSGSGPTVFGFFDDYKKAKASQDSFSYMYKDVYLTTTL